MSDQIRLLMIASMQSEDRQRRTDEAVTRVMNRLSTLEGQYVEHEHLLRVENGRPSILARVRDLENVSAQTLAAHQTDSIWWWGMTRNILQWAILLAIGVLLGTGGFKWPAIK